MLQLRLISLSIRVGILIKFIAQSFKAITTIKAISFRFSPGLIKVVCAIQVCAAGIRSSKCKLCQNTADVLILQQDNIAVRIYKARCTMSFIFCVRLDDTFFMMLRFWVKERREGSVFVFWIYVRLIRNTQNLYPVPDRPHFKEQNLSLATYI